MKKKFSIFILVLSALGALAQEMSPRYQQERNFNNQQLEIQQIPLTPQLEADIQAQIARKAVTTTLITEPQGDIQNYAMTFYYYAGQYVGLYDDYDWKVKLVFNEDGKTVYFPPQLVPGYMQGYAKGTIDGDLITVESGQYVYNYNNTSKLYLIVFTADANGNMSLVDKMTYSLKEDLIATKSTECYYGIYQYGTNGSDGTLASYSCAHSFALVSGESALPDEDAVIEKYRLSCYDRWRDGEMSYVVNVAIKNDLIWISGLAPDAQDSYIIGNFDGTTATFESCQLIDGNESYYLGVTGANITSSDETNGDKYSVPQDMKFTLTRDADGVFRMPDKTALIENYYTHPNYLYDAIKNVVLAPYDGDVPAVPAAPREVTLTRDDVMGDSFKFILPTEDIDGNYINPEKLYYRLYIDDKLYTFSKSQYLRLKQDMTDVPYNFYDNYDFSDNYENGYKLFYFYETDWQTADLQSVYVVDGETNVSTKTRVYADPEAGIKDVLNKKESTGHCYDLQGRRITAPYSGLYIQDGKLKLNK